MLADLVEDRKDSDSWELLSTHIWPTVSAALSRYGGARDAQSIHNEVLMRIYRYARLELFRNGEEFLSYVYSIVQSMPVESDTKVRHIEDPESDWIGQIAEFHRVDLAICRDLLGVVQVDLTSEESKLANLLITEGLSREKIAKLTGATEGALAARITRLKQKITRILEAEKKKS